MFNFYVFYKQDDISRELESFVALYDELKVVFNSCEKPRGTRLQVACNYFKVNELHCIIVMSILFEEKIFVSYFDRNQYRIMI